MSAVKTVLKHSPNLVNICFFDFSPIELQIYDIFNEKCEWIFDKIYFVSSTDPKYSDFPECDDLKTLHVNDKALNEDIIV